MADSGDNFFKGFILGGLVGGALGILFAPKSGRDMRADLGVELDKAREDLEHAKKAALKAFEESKERILESFKPDNEEPVVEEEEEKPKPRKRAARRRTRPGKAESDK
jgi:gas vesicle protein